MLKLAALMLLTGFASAAAHAGASSPLAGELARRGFSCVAAPNGDICTIRSLRGTSPKISYSEPIGILIPPGVNHPSDLILHLHGFRGVCEAATISPARMANNFEMLSSMKSAGATNSVMIFPMSVGHEDTFNAELVPQFNAFVSYMTTLLEPRLDSRWVISGHSGAFAPIGSILARADERFIKKLDSVILLDATYKQKRWFYSGFQRAAKINKNMDVYTVYRQGGGTEAGSRGLTTALPGNHVEVERSATQSHCQVPNKYMAPTLAKSIARHHHETAPTTSAENALTNVAPTLE